LNYPIDFLALIASCLALYFIIRTKKTYFLDSGFFIGLATVGFTIYLAEATLSDVVGSPVSAFANTLLIGIMGTSIGIASYLLKGSDQKTPSGIPELRRFVSRPPLGFLVYLTAVWAWTLTALILQPWKLNQMNVGGTIYYYTYPSWFIVASTLLVVAFIGLPVLSFYRQSRIVREKTASLSIKIISICWAMFGLSLFFQYAAGGLFLPVSQSIGFVADSLLFVLISFALREPTILARIITAGETVSQVVSSHSEVDAIVLYNTESDRRKLVETFVKDGLATGQNVVCRVTKSEVPFYRAVLKSSDLPDLSANKQSVAIQPIETAQALSADASMQIDLSRNRRELVDLDDLSFERSQEIIENVTTSDDASGVERIGRIWAMSVEGAQAGILDLLAARNPKSRVIDLARQQDTFSNLLGLKHDSILGSRLLLEYEPTSNYEEVVQKFVKEFQANVESVAIFTNAGSPVYREFIEQRNVRLFSFSTKTSTPSRISNEQVLLPERDTSLLLDAVDKLLQAHTGRRIGIVFEVFTYLILSLGFEKAYGVISSVVEMAESELATILVLVNSDALEPRVLSGIRGLFQSQLFFNSSGLRAVRLAGEEYGKSGRATESFSDVQEPPRGVEI
jgi:hypothetical protein